MYGESRYLGILKDFTTLDGVGGLVHRVGWYDKPSSGFGLVNFSCLGIQFEQGGSDSEVSVLGARK